MGNPVVHFEIVSEDHKALVEFYGDILFVTGGSTEIDRLPCWRPQRGQRTWPRCCGTGRSK